MTRIICLKLFVLLFNIFMFIKDTVSLDRGVTQLRVMPVVLGRGAFLK